MKPNLRTVGLLFALAGLALGGWGLLQGAPRPIPIAAGVVSLFTGIGLWFRLKLAQLAAVAFAIGALELGGWRLYQSLESSEHMGMLKGGAILVLALYVILALVLNRREFSAKPSWQPKSGS